MKPHTYTLNTAEGSWWSSEKTNGRGNGPTRRCRGPAGSARVDALGIPSSRIVVGPLRADVALLPTPGLVYRPLSHALRRFRRRVLERMRLDHSVVGDRGAGSDGDGGAAVANRSVAAYRRRFCGHNGEPEIRVLFSERSAAKATAEQKQVRLPSN